ncbi:hypothetical protein [Streptomyces sp. NPDC088733]|uniref:hypothetical protein n=1 Tax=Streptomyces sp. NPDC088733 TaxID=3365880 RepID=UPI003810D04C
MNETTSDERAARIKEITTRTEAAYPGPWRWRGNTEARHMRLQSPHGGGMTVMDFDRWGMQGAQPRFAIDRMMHKAEELVTYEVHRLDWVDKSEPPYRADIDGIDHPDAEFIAHAREDIPFLLGELDRTRAELARLRTFAEATELRHREIEERLSQVELVRDGETAWDLGASILAIIDGPAPRPEQPEGGESR